MGSTVHSVAKEIRACRGAGANEQVGGGGLGDRRNRGVAN